MLDAILYAVIATVALVVVTTLLRLRANEVARRGGKRSPDDDARHPLAAPHEGDGPVGRALSAEVGSPPDDAGGRGSFTLPQDVMSPRRPDDRRAGPPLSWSPHTAASGGDERPG